MQEISNKITTKDMKAAIARSGYLLEQRVEDVLRRKDYAVQANPIFPYPDTQKSGEYDIDAYKGFKVYSKGEVLNATYLQLLCECKNNPQPMVFFDKEIESSDLYRYDIKYSGIPVKYWDVDSWQELCDFTRIERFHHYCTGTVATQWCTFNMKKGEKSWMAFHNDDQHGAFDSLLKALNYSINDHYNSWEPEPPYDEGVDISIYYPLVILEGDLYSASIKKGNLKLRKSKLIHFSKEYYSSTSDKVEKCHFDVITESYLNNYLQIIETEVIKVRNSLRRQKKKVIASIDEILKEVVGSNVKTDSYRNFLEF